MSVIPGEAYLTPAFTPIPMVKAPMQTIVPGHFHNLLGQTFDHSPCSLCGKQRINHVWTCFGCGKPLQALDGKTPMLHSYKDHPPPMRHRSGGFQACPKPAVVHQGVLEEPDTTPRFKASSKDVAEAEGTEEVQRHTVNMRPVYHTCVLDRSKPCAACVGQAAREGA